MNMRKALSKLMVLCLLVGITSNAFARRHRTRNWSRRKKAFVGLLVGGALGAGIGAGIGAGAASCCCSHIGAAAGGGAVVGATVGTAVGATRDDNNKK